MDDNGSKETILRKSKIIIKHILEIKSLIITSKANYPPTKIVFI